MKSGNHKFITFLRIVKAGAQNFVRNATLAIAAMAVMLITLTIILFSVVANATFANTINQITDKIDVSVYLADNIKEDERKKLIEEVRQLENVESVQYISKEEALAIYKKANENNVDLLLAISQTDNPLPASLRIKPKDPNKIEDIRQYLEQPAVKALQSDETSYSGDRKEAIDKISQSTTFFREAGIAGIIIFTVVSMMIIFNTIRMAIFNRRDELQIMRLLGASTWFIRGPFVVETVIYGIVAALLSVGIIHFLFSVASQAFLASSFGLLDISYASNYFTHHFWTILGLQVLIGVSIGAASSMVATRRYLKFKSSK